MVAIHREVAVVDAVAGDPGHRTPGDQLAEGGAPGQAALAAQYAPKVGAVPGLVGAGLRRRALQAGLGLGDQGGALLDLVGPDRGGGRGRRGERAAEGTVEVGDGHHAAVARVVAVELPEAFRTPEEDVLGEPHAYVRRELIGADVGE